ncbi:ABC transporter substrate-binding protein [Ferrimonas pelagia]|uniref:ABC transporter substrate-binding protein n=1 Tax=Ferrimonas pelagia TaxID=1177826 RepID=A0ABP9EGC8_9GAMM
MRALFLCAALLCSVAFTAAGQPIELTDHRGRQVSLPQPASRIVSTYLPSTLFSLSLGLEQQLVGIGQSDRQQRFVDQLLGEHDPIAVGSRTAGLNLETIVALQPDLVLMHDKKDGIRLAAMLEQLGLAVLLVKAETLEEVDATLGMIATATGRQAQAQRVRQANLTLRNELEQRLQGVAPRHRSYYVKRDDLFSTASGEMYQHQMLQLAGLTNVAADLRGFFPKVDAEQLLRWQPQLLVIEDDGLNRPQRQLQHAGVVPLRQLPQLTLPADSLWSMPSPFALAGAYYLASQAYPQRFATAQDQNVLADYYQQIFNRTDLLPKALWP